MMQDCGLGKGFRGFDHTSDQAGEVGGLYDK